MSQSSRDNSRAGLWIYRHMGVLLTVYLVLLTGAIAVAFAENHRTADRREQGDAFSARRDLARQYQRCQQSAVGTAVINAALKEIPQLRAAIRAQRPDLLQPDGTVPRVDCDRTYPDGLAASREFPGEAQTRPPFTKTP